MSVFDNRRALLLDLGGTLIEFEGQPWDELERRSMKLAHRFLLERGFSLPEADALADEFVSFHTSKWPDIGRTQIELSFDDICNEFLCTKGVRLEEDLRAFTEAFYAPISEQLRPIEGGIELISAAKERGLMVGLVSNSPFPGDWHRREMDRFGLLSSFDYTVFSSEFGMRKPHASIFMECLSKLGVEAKDAIHVGDRPAEDIAGAQSVGAAAILIRRPDRKLTDDIKPDYIVDRLKDILNL
jgi:putative hydrolase of the HAD superfamily